MRFGLNTFLVSPGFTDADIPLLQDFRAYGAEVVELAIVEPSAVSPLKLKSSLEALGLERPILCGAFGNGRDLRGSAEQAEASSRYISQLIDLAVELEAPLVCGPMYSETGRAALCTTTERKAHLEQIVSALRPLCSQAEAAGIVLAVEPLNRFETDCINTLEQAVDLIERVGSDALKIHIDTFHMHIEETNSAEAIRHTAGHIAHVHTSASHRGLLGEDQVDWSGVLAALGEIGYTGDLVIESFAHENSSIANAASIWRPLFKSPEELAVKGLEFLHKSSNLMQPTLTQLT